MPGRTDSHLGHRYGFNGKEMDNGVKGEGVQYDYGFRIYDARMARFLSVDPLTASYPWYTPYQFAGNKPIWAIDLDGKEEDLTNDDETLYTYYGSNEIVISGSRKLSVHEKNAIMEYRWKKRSQTGTGFGLSVNQLAVGQEEWTKQLKRQVAGLLFLGASGPLAAGAVALGSPAYFKSVALNYAIEFGTQLLFDKEIDIGRVDHFDKLLPSSKFSNLFTSAINFTDGELSLADRNNFLVNFSIGVVFDKIKVGGEKASKQLKEKSKSLTNYPKYISPRFGPTRSSFWGERIAERTRDIQASNFLDDSRYKITLSITKSITKKTVKNEIKKANGYP
jgi:RHS repeat-associated protein